MLLVSYDHLLCLEKLCDRINFSDGVQGRLPPECATLACELFELKAIKA